MTIPMITLIAVMTIDIVWMSTISRSPDYSILKLEDKLSTSKLTTHAYIKAENQTQTIKKPSIIHADNYYHYSNQPSTTCAVQDFEMQNLETQLIIRILDMCC
jgi:hypothetical protein